MLTCHLLANLNFTMNVIIIYDAEFPSTKIMARAIGAGFSINSRVRLGDAKMLEGRMLPEMYLLIVGSPDSRSKVSGAVRNFLTKLPKNALQNVAVASFTTQVKRRFSFAFLFGKRGRRKLAAAQFIDKMLIKKGGIHVLPPENFDFKTQTKPQDNRELYRARQWGSELESLCRI